MSTAILTQVEALVPVDKEQALVKGFRELVLGSKPDGLLRTELLQGSDGDWRIDSLWRDREALQRMRLGTEPPAAPALFRRLGCDPALRIFTVVADSVL